MKYMFSLFEQINQSIKILSIIFVRFRYHRFINLCLRFLDTNKITSFVRYSSFVLHLFHSSHPLSFTNAFRSFSFIIFVFFVFILTIHLFFSFTWWTTSFHSLHWMEAFIWSSSRMNDPSLVACKEYTICELHIVKSM